MRVSNNLAKDSERNLYFRGLKRSRVSCAGLDPAEAGAILVSEIQQLSANQIEERLEEFIELLQLTVNQGASIGWLAPLSRQDASSYWQSVSEQVEAGEKVLILAEQDGRIAGAVQLALEPRENGNHRAEVQKLMVHPDFRRQGIAERLMNRLERAAMEAERSLLVLDVRKGDGAEALYQKLGYIHVGDITAYARSSNLQLDDCAFYYKLLGGKA